MQDTTEFRTNRDLFSNHYLDEHLPETDAWESVDAPELQEAYDDIVDLWERERDLVADRNESQLEEKFIRPMFRKLGIPFEVEESVEQGQRRPDYGFFESDEGARAAFTRRRDGGDFYKNAVAVADAKRWGRKLDTRGEQQRDFENPSYQIHVYLQETPATWAVLTNGEYWRLYYGPTSHRLDSYYEIHLPTVLESDDLDAFKYFYLFFHHEAFLPDASSDCFLDDVYSESNVFAEELGEDLQDNIYDAIQSLAEGFLTYPENDLGADDLDLIHDSSLIYLYRLIFVLYAESEGRDLLNTDNEIYERSYSLNTIKQEVAEELDSDSSSYQNWQDDLWNRIDELFQLIDQGSASRGIPEEDLHIPAYNGGLFRTNPDSDDSRETRFLATHAVGDEYLARVIELLTRSQTGSSGKIFVDYSSLDVRHLGSIYEGLLEYQLNVADEPLTLDNGEYVLADGGAEVAVESGEVYLTTDSGERKATGSYYTPEYVVEYIVENTLGPLVEDIREDLAGNVSYDDTDETGFAEEFAERVFDLKILDPAMGSGHFLTNTIDYLAREIIDAQERQAEQQGVETVGEEQDINWARRQVAQHCIYGVDLNPLAVELAKVSLWLRTLAAEQPLAFLDHHLKTGNSLVGSDIESIDELETDANGGPNASLADFGAVRRGTIDHLMDVYEEFITIENTDLADAKEMERKYREIKRDDLRNRLVAIANVKTAENFDLDLPGGAYEQMARALDSDNEWADVEATDWFQSAQAMAKERNFLHWKLDFPEVFYEIDGSARENPGFDVVIGNPPYVEVDGPIETYIRDHYEAAEYFIDLFHAFIERGIDLNRSDGQFGYIVPAPWLTIENKRRLRDLLLRDTWVRQIVRFDNLVFDQATVDSVIVIARKTKNPGPIDVLEAGVDDRVSDHFSKLYSLSQSKLATSDDNRIEIRQNAEERDLLERIRSEALRLEDVADLSIGVQAYNSSKHTQEQIEKRVFHSNEKKSNDYLPEITGSDIDRYYIESNEESWIEYGEHLHDCRDMRFLTGPRLLIRQIPGKGRYKIRACYVEKTYCNYNTVLNVLSIDGMYPSRYLLAIINSSLMSWIFPRTANSAVTDSFPKLSVVDLQSIPIREIRTEPPNSRLRNRLMATIEEFQECYPETLNDVHSQDADEESSHSSVLARDILSSASKVIERSKKSRKQLNLFLPDYLGTYGDGPTLGDLYQPPTGLADSILTDTATERVNLRVGTVTVAEEGSKLVIRATARYKPENPDEHETDRWDYTETDPEPAMEFVDLSDAERALIRAFVPHTTDEAGGFAGFRETATKTNSLVDRLEALTLPELSDIEDGLERYQKQKKRAEELDEKIEKTDETIDQIVYQLYGLTDEEIEIIEEAVDDD